MSITRTSERTSRTEIKNRSEITELLNQQLANISDLYTQTKYAHWNVKGSNFWGLHKLFDKLAEDVEESIDTLAERLTAIGGVARGTARMIAASSQLEEFPEGTTNSESVLEVMEDAFGSAGNKVRDAIDQADEWEDKDTADVLTETSRMLDQSLYFLESHNVQ